MFEYRAPDGSVPDFVYSTTLYSFTLPPRCVAEMVAYPNQYWEQCALIYVQGYRLERELGTFERPVTATIFAQPYEQQVILTGWHKEGEPNSELPWLPSQSISSPGYVAWRDTNTPDAPFDDLRVYIVISPPAARLEAYTKPSQGIHTSVETRAYQMAHQLTYLTTIADAGRQMLVSGDPGSPSIASTIDRMISGYLAASDAHGCRERAADLLACELVTRGHTLHAGSLRERLLETARAVIARGGTTTAGHEPHALAHAPRLDTE